MKNRHGWMGLRPLWKSAGILAAVLVFIPAPVWGVDEEKVNTAIDRAIDYLVSRQRDDGRIIESDKNETAMTSLALLAMASIGHMPGDPTPEGDAMRKGLGFVLLPGRQSDNGYYGGADDSRMYGHGIATLLLAEMLGMGLDSAQDELIRERCQSAIDLILRAQAVKKNEVHKGGWRYKPNSSDSDLSVTVWQLMALRAAKNAGMDVPKQAIDDAVEYVKRSYIPRDQEAKKQLREGATTDQFGVFSYQVRSGHKGMSTAAEGLLALQVSGEYDAPETLGAAEWLFVHPPTSADKWFFYGTYYYAQGMHQRGGEFREVGHRQVTEVLLPLQREDGSWDAKGEGKDIYATSMAVLSLAVRHHFLPIYQR